MFQSSHCHAYFYLFHSWI
uniref:Uncharacterized protein n=1 Tax=Arundo donax TaxID=35708 RepID=A0A0A9A8N6_ARUDO